MVVQWRQIKLMGSQRKRVRQPMRVKKCYNSMYASTLETGEVDRVPTCREIDPKIMEGFKFKKKGKLSKSLRQA